MALPTYVRAWGASQWRGVSRTFFTPEQLLVHGAATLPNLKAGSFHCRAALASSQIAQQTNKQKVHTLLSFHSRVPQGAVVKK